MQPFFSEQREYYAVLLQKGLLRFFLVYHKERGVFFFSDEPKGNAEKGRLHPSPAGKGGASPYIGRESLSQTIRFLRTGSCGNQSLSRTMAAGSGSCGNQTAEGWRQFHPESGTAAACQTAADPGTPQTRKETPATERGLLNRYTPSGDMYKTFLKRGYHH